MFEYKEDLITLAQSDIECGVDTVDELNVKKSSLINSESYAGKGNVDTFFSELANIKLYLEEIDELILNTKNNIESVSINAVFEESADAQMLSEIMEMINNLPLTEEQKAEALRLLNECSVRSSYAYLCVISCEQEAEYYDAIIEELYGCIARPDFNPERFPEDAIISDLIKQYEALRDAINEEKIHWERSLKLWKYDFLDKTDLSDVGNIFETTIGPILSCLYNSDGSLSLPYEEWSVWGLNTRLLTQSTSLQEQSVLDFAMYMYQDEGYRNWYYQEHGEQLTKEDVLLYLGIGSINNSEGSLQTRAFLYMNDEEYSKYKWLYANKGADEAQDYLNAIENDINAQYATDLFLEDVDKLLSGASSDSAFIRELEVLGISIKDGVINWADNTATTFNGNTNYTVTEYKQMMMSKLLVSGLACAPLTQTDLDMQLQNGEITQEQYAELTGSKKSVTTLDVMLLRGEISNQEYEQYKVILDDPSFKSLSEKIGASERKAMGYISSAGTSVGNMIPSVLASACITMAGGGGAAAVELGKTVGALMMWTSAYGSSYKTGVRSGQSEQRAMLYAALSATTEAVGEKYLGAIPFIGESSKVVNFDSKILSLLVNGAANLGKEVVQEEIQGVFLQNMIDYVVLGKEIDLSSISDEAFDTCVTTIISTLLLGGVGGALQVTNSAINANPMIISTDTGTITITSEDLNVLSKAGLINVSPEGTYIIDTEGVKSYIQVKRMLEDPNVAGKEFVVRTDDSNVSLPTFNYKFSELIQNVSSESGFENMLKLARSGRNNSLFNSYKNAYAELESMGALDPIISNRIKILINIFDNNFELAKQKSALAAAEMDRRYINGYRHKYVDGDYTLRIWFPENYRPTARSLSEDEVAEVIMGLPTKLRDATKQVSMWDDCLPSTHYWKFAFSNPEHYGIMCAGRGDITITNDIEFSKSGHYSVRGVIVHEAAHNLDGNGVYSSSELWQNAIKKDGVAITGYATASYMEDFAESVSYFFADPVPLYEKCPERAAVLEQIFPEEAESVRKQVEETKKQYPSTEKIIPTTEKIIPTTEKIIPTTEKIIPTTEKIIKTEGDN